MSHYEYLLLLLGCLLITLPLELVLGARVYRRPRAMAISIGVTLVVFAVWDVVAIARGHWWYSPEFISGVELPGRMPVEELLFFVVVPLCALLTYEAVGRVLRGGFPRPGRRPAGKRDA